MRTVSWVRRYDRLKAAEVCNKLIAAGARIINIADTCGWTVVWFEHELAFDEDWVAGVIGDGDDGRVRDMREIKTHRVGGVDDRLRIEVLDGPGPGGACHQYKVSEDTEAEQRMPSYMIKFQKGPIQENGLNGMTQEVLLAIVADRLEGFQSGDFACDLNQTALEHVREAMAALQQRTRDRIARDVEGKSEQ